jgi:hypothetical protein
MSAAAGPWKSLKSDNSNFLAEKSYFAVTEILEPILRLWNLQLQRQRCSRLERFMKVEEYIFVFKKL